MPLDFSKLKDPVWRDERRREREAEEARVEAQTQKQRHAVDRCDEHYEELTAAERSLVNNVRHRLNTWQPLTEKQETWLLDIAKRFPPLAQEAP